MEDFEILKERLDIFLRTANPEFEIWNSDFDGKLFSNSVNISKSLCIPIMYEKMQIEHFNSNLLLRISLEVFECKYFFSH